jgi:hypothetical protein
MSRQFENFDLEFSRAGDGYTARVLSSPGGEGSQAFTIPVNRLELENVVMKFTLARSVRSSSSVKEDQLRTLGNALFRSVFAGDVHRCYERSLSRCDDDTGLRIRLRFEDTPELVNLPWELLYDDGSDTYVALGLDTPIVRYIRMPTRIAPLRVTGPLNVLTVVSNPSDLPALMVESEAESVESALRKLDASAPGCVVAETLRRPTPDALQRNLMKRQWHVLHFIGHSEFNERLHVGTLILEDENQRARPVSAERLSVMLQGRSLKLVILNSCEGAQAGEEHRSGLAQSLIAQGVPAVIAMQFPITDTSALTFSRMFYHALVSGTPLEGAMAEARRAMYIESEVEWATPTLYLRAENGTLFDRPDTAGIVIPPPLVVETPPAEDLPKPPEREAVLRTVVPEPLPSPTPTPNPTPTPKPKTEPDPPPWWKRPFVIPGALVAIVALFIVVARHSAEPNPEPPAILRYFTPLPVSSILATPDATPSAVATATAVSELFGGGATLKPSLPLSVPQSQTALGARCPMAGASVAQEFVNGSAPGWEPFTRREWTTNGSFVIDPGKNSTERVWRSDSLTNATICTTVERWLTFSNGADGSGAGLAFWGNRDGFWIYYVTSAGSAFVYRYNEHTKEWSRYFSSVVPILHHDTILATSVLTVRFSGPYASFYLDGAKMGQISDGPAPGTRSGLFAETSARETSDLRWYFGSFGVGP